MKMKNVLWAALVGVAVSCTVSRRIDKWGYRVSFDKKSNSEVVVAEENAQNEIASTQTGKLNVPLNKLEKLVDKEIIGKVETIKFSDENPVVVGKTKVQFVKNNHEQALENVVAVKLNKKAERIMAKLYTNEAKSNNANRTENWVYILLILLVPFGTTISMYLYEGSWTKRVTTNLILTLLCGLPGFIHALVVIFGNK
jgi:uncharacterized membrane protein YqaE (UPF0057 family)